MSARRIPGKQMASGIVLVAWSTFFVYLWVSGEAVRFIGPRTSWVVPFGAVALGATSILYLSSALRSRSEPVTAREALAHFVTVLPIVAVLVVPAPSLGALAASKKTASISLAGGGTLAPPGGSSGPLSFIDVHYAAISDHYAQSAGIAEGTPLRLTGFVTHDPDDAAGFRLTRFYISCCAADAIPYSVHVATDRAFENDRWLEIEGVLTETADGFSLVPERLDEVAPPESPYLS